MNDKHLERQVESVMSDLVYGVDLLVNKIEELEQEIENLQKQHEQALDESYDKGYNEAYNKGYNEAYKNSVIVHSELYK